MSSVFLVCKGPSFLRSVPKDIKECDEIVITNYPVMTPFFKEIIGNRNINYHYANCATPDHRYNVEICEKYNIYNILNTNSTSLNYKKILGNRHNNKFKITELYKTIVQEIKDKYSLDPSTGLVAFYDLVKMKKYSKIIVSGLDNFEKNNKMYYYDIKNINPCLKKLVGVHSQILPDGSINFESGHDRVKTKELILDLIESNPDIDFKFITNMDIKRVPSNLTIG